MSDQERENSGNMAGFKDEVPQVETADKMEKVETKECKGCKKDKKETKKIPDIADSHLHFIICFLYWQIALFLGPIL